jgi:hypothetical protein
MVTPSGEPPGGRGGPKGELIDATAKLTLGTDMTYFLIIILP